MIFSPYSAMLNNTPNTDSRLKNSEACAGGMCASATFWMPNATMDANSARNTSWPIIPGVNTPNPGNVSNAAPNTKPRQPSATNCTAVSASTSWKRDSFDTSTMCTANSSAHRSVMASP